MAAAAARPLIGAGGRANDLMGELALAKAENFSIAAICDVYRVNREAAVARVEKEFGGRPRETTRYGELLAWPDIDAVIIATPDFTHNEILRRAVEAGKDVYCEKPMGVNLTEAKQAYFAVKQSGPGTPLVLKYRIRVHD
jgi:myo-inositol 2-dehydrogenase/D-chiro-inositol 1-dehydrogenase